LALLSFPFPLSLWPLPFLLLLLLSPSRMATWSLTGSWWALFIHPIEIAA
jgi:hypothetical protein